MESVLSSVPRTSASPGPDALDHLLAPLGLAEFLSDYWGKGHRFVHRRDQGHYRDLFTLDDLDRCMASGISKPGVIASFIPPQGSDRKFFEGAITSSSLDLSYKRFAEGDTIRVVGIERLDTAVMQLALRLQELLGAKVHVNSYLTPASSQGFAVHFDYHDAFILQVSGSKHWFVYDPEHLAPVDLPFAKIWKASPDDPSSLTLREEGVLEAGDLLYIPRGFYHEARTANEHSLHLTVSLDPVYWVSVLQKSLELLCRELPELRRALPPGFPARRTEAGEDLEATFRSLLDLVREHASFEKTARFLFMEELSATHHPPDGHFSDLVRLEEIGSETLVEKRAGFVPVVELRNGNAVLQFGANHVQGPAAILPALEFVRDHRIFKAADLPGSLTGSSRVVLVRRLIREGLLKIHGR
jgi:ribosomal protein L16 Arg81 hydroxylase